MGKLDRFPKLLQSKKLMHFSKREVVEMKVQFGWLAMKLDELENQK